jgi:hypothetical protein
MLRHCKVVIVLGFFAVAAAAQNQSFATLGEPLASVSDPSPLPDAPSYIEGRTEAPVLAPHEALAADPYQRLTTKQKWDHFLHRSFSPATYLGDAEDTTFTWLTGGFIYCCGIGAWGKQYAADLADGESRTFFGNFLLPTLLKQDPRYFPLRHGSVKQRAWYAATRIFVARTDSGKPTFNFSEIGGLALSKALSNAYYPDHECGGRPTAYNILGGLQGDVTSNELREFWPEITSLLRRHTPRRLQELSDRLPLSNSSPQY